MPHKHFIRSLEDAHHKPPLIELWLLSQWNTIRTVFFYGDTVTIRSLLMVASLGQAIGFALPLGTMERPYFADMRFLPSWAWAALYLVHAVGQWWRFRSGENKEAGFVVNLYGFLLWTFTTLLGTFATHAYTPATALEWTAVTALFFALIRTGDPTDRLSP